MLSYSFECERATYAGRCLPRRVSNHPTYRLSFALRSCRTRKCFFLQTFMPLASPSRSIRIWPSTRPSVTMLHLVNKQRSGIRVLCRSSVCIVRMPRRSRPSFVNMEAGHCSRRFLSSSFSFSFSAKYYTIPRKPFVSTYSQSLFVLVQRNFPSTVS